MSSGMKKVSVIIPVYNVEKYLPACLDSVLGQSLDELECICIDDASPDRCGEILDEYAARDERVRVLHLPENHMQGYGRNRGLEMAQGKYVYFLDSDDMISSNAMEELFQLAERDDLEGIYFDSQVLLDSEDLAHFAESYIGVRQGEYPDQVMTGRALMELFMENNEWMVYVQRQFWRRDYLLKNGIFFPEGIIHEDEFFSFQAAMLAQRVSYTRKEYFFRRYRSDSVMTRVPKTIDFVSDFKTFCQMVEFSNERKLSGKGVDQSIHSIFVCTVNRLDLFYSVADPEDWFTPEEQKNYQLFLAFLKNQRLLRGYDLILWAPLALYKTVWLYGAGHVAKRVYLRMQECGLPVGGFIVTSPEGNPEKLFDLPVRPIGTVERLSEDEAVVIAMASSMQDGPAEILREKGIPYFLFFNNLLTGPLGMETGTH